MPDLWNNASEPKTVRVKLTARVSSEAYDLITQMQRRFRIDTGRALPLWKVIDEAIRAYARTNPIAS